jgi:hypothetical protein
MIMKTSRAGERPRRARGPHPSSGEEMREEVAQYLRAAFVELECGELGGTVLPARHAARRFPALLRPRARSPLRETASKSECSVEERTVRCLKRALIRS